MFSNATKYTQSKGRVKVVVIYIPTSERSLISPDYHALFESMSERAWKSKAEVSSSSSGEASSDDNPMVNNRENADAIKMFQEEQDENVR